uniref:BZIP domain-containing protein n=2 Tax=Chaetoceros debilis TaxID=122233 RepID=A0A7S3Q0S8_9STRA|eukprot:CAMPEP_0194084820 /NCGR_PEP_ID=MMETSP0149-20130528/14933_1 /TAXON_ID=122233 /ORGANISM="Chaetoceros debilis, Strain MM31A-1" /LENGTH=527 /DNA_ID=CAMNT_0038767571 /DNA_START=179 /DNA_END=1762 /DNA_ORIENTATION=+
MNQQQNQQCLPDTMSIMGTAAMEIQQQPLADDGEEGPSKRQAMKGQWQTPPVGEIFPSASSMAQKDNTKGTAVNTANVPAENLPVPSTSDDYARALQEAYRRGAEAAAALSGNKTTNTAPVNISVQSFPIAPVGTHDEGSVAQMSNSSISKNAPNMVLDTKLHPATVPSSTIGAGTNSATKMGVPSPLPFFNNAASSSTINAQTKSHIPPSHKAITPSIAIQTAGSFLPENITSSSTSTNILSTNTSQPKVGVSRAQRSASMPDMSLYSSEKPQNDEEAKRLKRLARNRASARLRRLRKKNLVESYEAEVGVLESSLSKLQGHRWGVGADSEALLEALSMDRGQQQIDKAKRTELITSILSQQREQVRNLMDCQLENMVLGWVSQHGEIGGPSDAGQPQDPSTQAELDELALELNDVLNLSPDQKSELQSASHGMEEERKAIETIYTSLTALMSNSWLMNSGIEECTEQFTSILNPTQMSKFLLWADHNSEAIDQLDYVNAPPANAQPNSSPTFAFGIDESTAMEES